MAEDMSDWSNGGVGSRLAGCSEPVCGEGSDIISLEESSMPRPDILGELVDWGTVTEGTLSSQQ